jgi:hypothetical protein
MYTANGSTQSAAENSNCIVRGAGPAVSPGAGPRSGRGGARPPPWLATAWSAAVLPPRCRPRPPLGGAAERQAPTPNGTRLRRTPLAPCCRSAFYINTTQLKWSDRPPRARGAGRAVASTRPPPPFATAAPPAASGPASRGLPPTPQGWRPPSPCPRRSASQHRRMLQPSHRPSRWFRTTRARAP